MADAGPAAHLLTPQFLTRALRASASASASLGPLGAVIALSAQPCGGGGKTGAQLLRVVPEYAHLPATTHDDVPPPPPSLLVKVASRRLDSGSPRRVTAWMAEQDAREVSFYREHQHLLRTPVVYHAHSQWPVDKAAGGGESRTCITCIVMEDLSCTHHSGEDAVAPLYYG